MAEFRMPSLGADMDAGTLVEWRVKVGDHVQRGDIVAVVQTQKAAIEVEIFTTGTIESLKVEEGSSVPVGTVLAIVSDEAPERSSAGFAPQAPQTSQASQVPEPMPPLQPREQPAAARTGQPRYRASPAARRRARELGLDPATWQGGDHILRLADVEALAARGPAKKPDPQSERRAKVRAATAAAMSRSKREIPHYYLSHPIDLEPSLRWLEDHNEGRMPHERLLPAVLLLKATAFALRELPEFNGFYRDGAFASAPDIHLNIGVSLRGGGVVAPAIHHVDRLELPELMNQLRDLVKRARDAGLRSSEFTDGTATVSSLGDRGVDTVFGVIYPPQVAVVGFGGIAPHACAVGGLLGVHRMVRATLAADHRASEGHRGSLLLRAIEDFLQEPETL